MWMEIPPCPNHLAGTCERSDTVVEAEKNECFVIRCKTCKGINIWPRDEKDNQGRYEGFLRQKFQEEQNVRSRERKREYSFRGGKG